MSTHSDLCKRRGKTHECCKWAVWLQPLKRGRSCTWLTECSCFACDGLLSGQCGLVSGSLSSPLPRCMSEPDHDDSDPSSTSLTPGHWPLTCQGLLRPNRMPKWAMTACHRGNILFYRCFALYYLQKLGAGLVTTMYHSVVSLCWPWEGASACDLNEFLELWKYS